MHFDALVVLPLTGASDLHFRISIKVLSHSSAILQVSLGRGLPALAEPTQGRRAREALAGICWEDELLHGGECLLLQSLHQPMFCCDCVALTAFAEAASNTDFESLQANLKSRWSFLAVLIAWIPSRVVDFIGGTGKLL